VPMCEHTERMGTLHEDRGSHQKPHSGQWQQWEIDELRRRMIASVAAARVSRAEIEKAGHELVPKDAAGDGPTP